MIVKTVAYIATYWVLIDLLARKMKIDNKPKNVILLVGFVTLALVGLTTPI